MLLSLAMFFSTIGTFLLLLSLAAKTFEQSGSGLLSGMIFGASWILSIFLFPFIGKLVSQTNTQKTLVISEITGGLFSLLIGFIYQSPSITLFTLLALRGITESITKSGREILFKEYIHPEKQKQASSVFESSYYLGTGLAGFFGAYLVNILSIFHIALIDFITFLISSLCYLLLKRFKRPPSLQEKNFLIGLKTITANPSLYLSVILLLTNVIFFQGAHNIARTILPMRIHQLGVSGVQQLQIIFCLAISSATFFMGKFYIDKFLFLFSNPLLTVVTILTLCLSFVAKSPVVSFFLYFLFAFFFEISFLKHKSDLRVYCPREKIGHVGAFCLALSQSGMVIIILFFGKIADFTGAFESVLVLSFTALTIVVLSPYFLKRKVIKNETSSIR